MGGTLPRLRVGVKRNCTMVSWDEHTELCGQILVETELSDVERLADVSLVEGLHVDMTSHLGIEFLTTLLILLGM